MLTFYRKYAKTIFDIGLIVLTVYLTMWLFSLIYGIAKPIFVGLLIFMMIEPMTRFFCNRGLKRSIATTLATLIFILIILGAVITAGIIFTSEILQLSKEIPNYAAYFEKQILIHSENLKDQIDALPPDMIDRIKGYTETIVNKSSGFLSYILNSLWLALTSVTSFLINFVIGLILAYFLSLEFDMWQRIAKEKTPSTFKKAYLFLKDNVLKGIMSYIKAQLKLVSITFIIILIGLLVLGVGNAFSIALLAAFFDLLPVLGISVVFIPWIIYLLIIGDMTLALWLLAIYGAVIIIRQILEPKITGESLGVSAFTMLAFMIISLSLFGVAGVILSPILLILIKALYDQGFLEKWIRKPEGEYGLDSVPNLNENEENNDLN